MTITAPRTSTATLEPELLQRIDAYWRAANYLSVGQIYLYDNPLLKGSAVRAMPVTVRRSGHTMRHLIVFTSDAPSGWAGPARRCRALRFQIPARLGSVPVGVLIATNAAARVLAVAR